MAARFTYKQYMTLTFDQWKRSQNYILDSMDADLKSKSITADQFKMIMARRDQLYTTAYNNAVQKLGDKADAATNSNSGSGIGGAISGSLNSLTSVVSGGGKWIVVAIGGVLLLVILGRK